MRRDACATCAGELTDFLDLGSSPPADQFPQDATAEEKWYPLVVAVCTSCWLAQLRDIVPDDELYGADYGFRTGSSPAAVKYFKQLAWDLLKKYGKRATTEIGCNDGTLLQCFKTAGCPVTGVEPSGAAVDTAERGIPVFAEPFSQEIAKQVRESRGPAGLVLAFNVAAHVADPLNFLAGVHELLADDGIAVIEFQDLAALIAGCQFDHVYHEHRFYFSRKSFSRLAVYCGLDVFDWERTSAQGGSVRVHLRRASAGFYLGGDRWLERAETYVVMQARVEYMRQQLCTLVEDELGKGRVIAGYGASAKSATLLNYCGFGSDSVWWVEDLTPGKIGRVTPGSHIPIRAPGIRPDTYLLTSWNYVSAVIRREREFLGNGGRFIIPGAVPVLL
jgi:methylation protein EvaC